MTFEELKYHLPIFILLFAILSFLWRRVRIKKSLAMIKGDSEILNKLSLLNRLYTGMFILVAGVVFLYAFYNEMYNWLAVPFHALDIVPINNFGVLILNISLIWIISTQMNLDTSVYRIASGKLDWETTQKIIIYSEKSILIGFLIMFVGVFVTISSLGSLLLALVSILIYYFLFIKKVNRNTPSRNSFIF